MRGAPGPRTGPSTPTDWLRLRRLLVEAQSMCATDSTLSAKCADVIREVDELASRATWMKLAEQSGMPIDWVASRDDDGKASPGFPIVDTRSVDRLVERTMGCTT
jgi:hypothetical protein